jgi:elongation factor Ts
MSISLEDVKTLREKTGAGMVDCKKALDEAGGDMESAVEALRKKGIAKAAKRIDRVAQEGVVKVAINNERTEGYMVEINAETDFVAKNEEFQRFADQVLEIISHKKPVDLEALFALPLDGSTVKDKLNNLSGVIGEKLTIHRFTVLISKGTVGAYTHMGGKIGVLLSLDKPGMQELAYDMAMQVAAASPSYLYPEDVPEEEKDKERDVYREQLKAEGKPEEMIEKIIEGKLNKYYEQVCLVKQEYIKDDKQKVENILGDVKVEKFIRYSL